MAGTTTGITILKKMGWSSSIHVRTNDLNKVIDCLGRVRAGKCVVGISGKDWVGVYSYECEKSGGVGTFNLASKLSHYIESYIIGICLYEDEFGFWLFRSGRLIDTHPLGRIQRFFFKNHEVLNLAINTQVRRQLEVVLNPKRKRAPHERRGISKQEFVKQATQKLERIQTMSSEEREQIMQEQSRLRSGHFEKFQNLCEGIGISEYGWNYSDFLPSTEENEEIGPPITMVWKHVA